MFHACGNHQHVEMQHRMFVPYFLQLVTDWIVTVFDQSLHERETFFESRIVHHRFVHEHLGINLIRGLD